MEETTDPFKETILNYLQELASKDNLFAKTFSKPYKNIEDCLTYILNEVKKSQRQGFSDDEIYNMAIHYYDEETVELGKPLTAKIVINRSIAKPKTSTKSEDAHQTTLFKL